MAIDYSLLLTLKSMFRDGKYGREHNKHDFDADYNNFVLMQDKLTILANYEQAHGGIDILLSYLDDNKELNVPADDKDDDMEKSV